MTTGSPRVGNQPFIDSFLKYVSSSTRYVYGGDIVTTVPPEWTGYRHIVEETHLGPERKIRLSVKDHLMDSYVEGIQ